MLAEGPAQHLLHIGDGIVKVDDLRVDHRRVDDGKRLARAARRPFGGQRDLPEVAADRLQALGRTGSGWGGEFRRDKGCVAEDHGEEVVEVLGDLAREPAEAFEVLRLLQPCPPPAC